jgi:hypothetical protein
MIDFDISDLVVKSIKLQGPDDKDDRDAVTNELKEILPPIKEMAIKMKKSAMNGNKDSPES